ncbi:hypothetical protein Poly41_59010 [Novipirellula artificiosorum]|uniref:Uncharacterized protein n=1 Tax=Novipirellula artificiosorum TaxID=2528016 RepID=A0A5C6D461_9BACT|nr:hypothetical protein Poly41_59010 [Novipirellula artificiosorum]
MICDLRPCQRGIMLHTNNLWLGRCGGFGLRGSGRVGLSVSSTTFEREDGMKPLIGNRSAEKDIRDWLAENGYCGRSAKFDEIELHAVKRPGWLQVFRFSFRGFTVEQQPVQLLGAMRSDERYGPPKIVVHEDLASRDMQLAEWSEGLITQRRHRN